MSISNYIIEIATTDYFTTKAAVEGGADRIELCASLVEGGTTPSYGTIIQCREAFEVDLFPIIRPRAGDFLYTEDEFQIMVKEIKLCKEVGCEGVVVGVLNADGSVNQKRTEKLINAAYPMEVTFHRAFDRCKDPFEALEQLITIGCQRILTSGQKPSVIDGIALVEQLVKAAADRIIIMPGSGVRKENILHIAAQTGAVEFHSSLRDHKRTDMQYIHPSFAHSDESYSNPAIQSEEVKSLRNALYA